MSLIIVESPTKARTFNRILKMQGDKKSNYFVFATMGHIRDLPGNKISVDYTKNFKPHYAIIKNKQKVVDQLKKLALENDEIILATDPDREGEAISYHAAYILDLVKEKWPDIKIDADKPLKRIVFHEITPHALEEALANPQTLRINLVKAQQARRILDRIVGYELSPLLWKTMGKNWLSAGRVQSVALRLIVEREKEIRAFKIEPYYQLYGQFDTLHAKLMRKNGEAYEVTQKIVLFAGDYQFIKTTIDTPKSVEIKTDLKSDTFTIKDIAETISPKYPPPPHTTSLLQQDGFKKFGFSSKLTMRLAQDLYERGLITYHRTDSFNLSTQFVFKAKDYIEKNYGPEYALEKPRGYRTKSKMAQEAHEAIRPTKLDKNPSDVEVDKKITQNHKKLYQLIFNRALATQMKEAQIKTIKVIVASGKGYELESEFQEAVFDGFLKLANPEFGAKKIELGALKVGNKLELKDVVVEEKKTSPPYRYNEASLIKTMEEKGIGRPSTYAAIISLIQDKNYVQKDFRYFTPTKLGEAISDYLAKHFTRFFSLDFTAQMEENLDKIAEGEVDMINVLTSLNDPLQKEIAIRKDDTEVIDVEEKIDEKCPKCSSQLVIRYSKFGKFMACSNYPKCKFTKPFLKFIAGYVCPTCGGRITLRFTKTRKKFYGCENYPTCKFSAWILSGTKKVDATAAGTTVPAVAVKV